MDQKIITSTATNPLGLPPGKKLLIVPSGPYAGRAVALIQINSTQLQFSWADAPYASWSTPETIASDSADCPFDAVIDADGNIQVVFAEETTFDLVTRRLTFSGGSWTVASPVTIFVDVDSYYPSLAIETDGKLWVAWLRKDGSYYYLNAKSSSDSGTTWGSGSSDAGDSLTNGVTSAYVKLLIDNTSIHAIYTQSGNALSIRSLPLAGGSWSTAEDIATSSGNLDEHFDAAVSSEGLIGVAYDNEGLKYREYDGSIWNAIISLDATEALWPQISFEGNVPVVVYLSQKASDQIQPMFTTRQTGNFATPEQLLSHAGEFDAVLLYNQSSASYVDSTSAAISATTADVYHTTSSALVDQVGDKLFLGMMIPFRYIKFLLSTAGVGGSVTWSYFDGSEWKAFTPESGAYHLSSTEKDLLLFEDMDAIPDDWQKCSVNSQNRFWIRLEVSSVFTTAPVGSQMTTISDIKAFCVGR